MSEWPKFREETPTEGIASRPSKELNTVTILTDPAVKIKSYFLLFFNMLNVSQWQHCVIFTTYKIRHDVHGVMPF